MIVVKDTTYFPYTHWYARTNRATQEKHYRKRRNHVTLIARTPLALSRVQTTPPTTFPAMYGQSTAAKETSAGLVGSTTAWALAL